ncbi:TPA: hypothetical protein N0F65_007580 [Lagenidium giganteum]|uniref:Serine aminopeptidase S33 domain-containing protein n=1 Tax=Lagenidium giganteum TaxID=4803 RepID=A0AAV2ZNQ1_9STRA|nr:TPA: hypothetical protein N0F65_007580 [Lagenidium giganteum]
MHEFLETTMEYDNEQSMRDVMRDCLVHRIGYRPFPSLAGLLGQTAAALSHYVSDERLREIRDHGFPILLLGGNKDIIIPAREMHTLHRIMGDAEHVECIMYEDAGHGVFVKYADEVAAAYPFPFLCVNRWGVLVTSDAASCLKSVMITLSGSANMTNSKHQDTSVLANTPQRLTHKKGKGFRLQRHVDAAKSDYHHFSQERVKKAAVSTGVTLEYAIHEHSLHAAESDCENESTTEVDEVRVIMIMGLLNSKEMWIVSIDSLLHLWKQAGHNAKLKVLSVDNRGIGGSDAPLGRYSTQMLAQDIMALMDHVHWDKVHIVSMSMGGMIALELAHLAPQRVQSLSLLVTSRGRYIPDPSSIAALAMTFATFDTTAIANNVMYVSYPDEFLETTMEYDNEQSMRDVMRDCLTAGSNSGRTIALCVGRAAARIRDHGFPILLLGGNKDIIIPAREMHTLHRIMGDAEHVECIMYEDAGHGVFVKYADEVAEDIMRSILRAS